MLWNLSPPPIQFRGKQKQEKEGEKQRQNLAGVGLPLPQSTTTVNSLQGWVWGLPSQTAVPWEGFNLENMPPDFLQAGG